MSPTVNHICLSEDQVKKRLNHIKQKMGGPDMIISREMAEAADSLSEAEDLFSIFENSIQRGTYHCVTGRLAK